ncbi:HalD/BesD family halogenase [Lentzea sp. HUAS TT2]|uniref:HalD/BesD family halogenase n=1 Tax=Lentzea sp. HUAS TT2 TaxID=3447454 RepID=UPI003F7178E5
MEAGLLEQVVNTTDYPLTEPDGAAWREVVERTHRDLHTVGCSVLPDFIRPALHEDLRREGAEIAPHAYYDVETVNAYNIDVDTPLPPDHPGRKTMERGNAFVARDVVPRDAIIHQLYTSEVFQRFVAACFELPELHELADPLSGLVLNVIPPGRAHPWHFDTNEFTVSMLTQAPEGGGEFQYCPNIRSADEENFDDVRAVLAGDDRLVQRLTLRAGDLQLFKGRYSLHQVSTVRGDRQRHTAIFAYSLRPGVVGTVARTRQLFGRVLPEHLAAEGDGVRVDERLA